MVNWRSQESAIFAGGTAAAGQIEVEQNRKRPRGQTPVEAVGTVIRKGFGNDIVGLERSHLVKRIITNLRYQTGKNRPGGVMLS